MKTSKILLFNVTNSNSERWFLVGLQKSDKLKNIATKMAVLRKFVSENEKKVKSMLLTFVNSVYLGRNL